MPDIATPRGQWLVFAVLPLICGLLTALTGSLLPIFVQAMMFLTRNPGLRQTGMEHGPDPVAAPGAARRNGLAGWWNRRRRFGFLASLSVLLMWALAFTRSALTGTWGGGDLLMAFILIIPLIVVFRRPPHSLPPAEPRSPSRSTA